MHGWTRCKARDLSRRRHSHHDRRSKVIRNMWTYRRLILTVKSYFECTKASTKRSKEISPKDFSTSSEIDFEIVVRRLST